MKTTLDDYKLSPAELPGIVGWIAFLETFGSGMPVISDATREFFVKIISVSDNFSRMTNPSYRWMIKSMFTSLNSITNNQQISLASQYMDFCNRNDISLAPNDSEYESVSIGMPFTFTSYWVTFLDGYGYRWGRRDDPGLYQVTEYHKELNIPHVDEDRYNAISALVSSWKPTPSNEFIVAQTTTGSQANKTPAAAAKKLIDDWATKNNMPAKVIIDFEANQRLKMNDLLKSTAAFNGDVYFFILHLLIGLCTGTAADKGLALSIVKEITSSVEYENEIFINQLIYLSLMYLGDPKGAYKYNNGQRQAALRDLLGVMKTTDDASIAIKASINTNLDILNADPSYPMQDMYNPDKGFNIRFTDTLAALEDGRKAIAAKLPK
ncbi:hypothetical protein [Pedobacter psychroterrae]|uniref:Uncharacterized protein n=1 Tax=Pedobacter psychroterrae TaxID=2530453 RepID=A0A4V2MLA4_9SPHI|nr:hypothetical protein [Pedobacter psychroterrae]TCD01187.1 hypothetical protein EZ437_10515 [Pedobacter psychroterrae]